jgi:hypothetical protein
MIILAEEFKINRMAKLVHDMNYPWLAEVIANRILRSTQ